MSWRTRSKSRCENAYSRASAAAGPARPLGATSVRASRAPIEQPDSENARVRSGRAVDERHVGAAHQLLDVDQDQHARVVFLAGRLDRAETGDVAGIEQRT